MRLVAIVCPNGLGHLRRSVGVLDQLSRRLDRLEAHLVCERWQIDRLRGWRALATLLDAGLTVHTDIMAPGVEWLLDADGYAGDRLSGWERRLAELAPLSTADVVLSDNLAAVLVERPDAVLLGSFLWSDTLEAAYGGGVEVDAFVERERTLLQEHSPPMLCVDELATAGVAERADAVRLPWMTEGGPPDASRRPAGRPTIGIATGASAVSGRRLPRLVHALAAEVEATLAVPEVAGALATAVTDSVPFRFTPADYATCAAILCRPGAGALTACVTARTPMLCLREPGNVEMEHNARRVEALGIGVDLGEDPSADAVVEAARAALRPDAQERMRAHLAARPSGGLELAAAWIQRYFERGNNRSDARRAAAGPEMERAKQDAP